MLVTFSNREPSVCKLKPFDTLNSDMVVCNYMHRDATKTIKLKGKNVLFLAVPQH